MSKDGFILTPGTWTGEGKIVLNMVEEDLTFLTTWKVLGRDFSGKIQCVQDIKIEGLSENMRNDFVFYDFGAKTFSIEMENPNVGRVVGTGVFDENLVAWEFRENDLKFEGYETYQLSEDGSYQMRGEYISSDQFRTLIEGKIWHEMSSTKTDEEVSENEGEEE